MKQKVINLFDNKNGGGVRFDRIISGLLNRYVNANNNYVTGYLLNIQLLQFFKNISQIDDI